MKSEEYSNFVAALKRNPELIYDQLSLDLIDLWHAVTGLCGEAGEVSELVKKVIVGKRPCLDRQELLHELGDVLFYLQMAMNVVGFTLDDVLEANVKKLSKRHPELADEYICNKP